MDDIQNIMNKMENLDKEVATTNESEKALVGLLKLNGSEPSDPSCPDFTRLVDLCCTAVVPTGTNGFTLQAPTSVKLIYNPNCLQAVVQQATVSICGTDCGDICVYLVKVVGNLPFAFSASNALTAPCGNTTPPESNICCNCSVCVNNNICCYSDAAQAEATRRVIAANLNCASANGIVISTPAAANVVTCTCSGGSPTFNKCPNETYVRFTATLTVPFQPCLAHISPNCGDI